MDYNENPVSLYMELQGSFDTTKSKEPIKDFIKDFANCVFFFVFDDNFINITSNIDLLILNSK